MASETFRRSKLIRWMKLQTQVIEQMNEIADRTPDSARGDSTRTYIQAKVDMLESLMKEFDITNEEIAG